LAKIIDQIAVVLGTQVAEGTINATVRDSTQVGTTEGGATALGVLMRKETLTLDIDRIEELGEDITGSFTKNRGFRLRTEASAFSWDYTLKGSGQTLTTPVAGEYNLTTVHEALLRGAGILRGTPTASQTPYALGTPDFLTIKVWRGNQSWVFQDCKVDELAIALTPGEVVVVTPTIVPGALTHRPSDTFPTVISYGLNETTTPPPLQSAGAQIGATVRGFLEGSLTIANEYEDFPDSNLPRGRSFEQTARTITWEGNFYVDSTNLNQDFLNLDLTAAPTEELLFQLGVNTTTPGAIANAIEFTMFNVNFTQQSVVQQARRIVYGLTGYATAVGTTANSEFSFRSR
jgi:hypothetical protein